MISTTQAPVRPSALFTDPRLSALTPWQENLFWRIRHQFSSTDASLTGDPADLRRLLYPRKPDIRESQMRSAITALTLAGLIAVYPDESGHPALQLVSAMTADPLSSVGGTIGGDDHHHQHPMMTVTPTSKKDGVNTEYVPNSVLSTQEYQGVTEKGYAEMLGVTDKDVAQAMERRNAIEYEARLSGLPLNPRAMQMAEDWAEEYSLDWLLKAIRQSALSAANWYYVLGTLHRWKERGSCDDVPPEERRHRSQTQARPTAKRGKKTAAELDEEARKWGMNPDEWKRQ